MSDNIPLKSSVRKAMTHEVRVRNCQFAFKCPKKWDELTRTSFDRVRHCSNCSRDVFLCTTDAELAESIKLDRCVAVDLATGPGSRPIRTVGVVDSGPMYTIDEESGERKF